MKQGIKRGQCRERSVSASCYSLTCYYWCWRWNPGPHELISSCIPTVRHPQVPATFFIYPLPDVICSVAIPRDRIKTAESEFSTPVLSSSWACVSHRNIYAPKETENSHNNWLSYFSFGEMAKSFRNLLCPINVSDETHNHFLLLQRKAWVPK